VDRPGVSRQFHARKNLVTPFLSNSTPPKTSSRRF
jgi:hypothetical protein